MGPEEVVSTGEVSRWVNSQESSRSDLAKDIARARNGITSKVKVARKADGCRGQLKGGPCTPGCIKLTSIAQAFTPAQ